MKLKSNQKVAVAALGAATLATAAVALTYATGRRNYGPPDSAPGRTAAGRRRFGEYAVVGRTVTINKPRSELYAFWRDFGNLPKVMDNVKDVRLLDGERAVWTISAPAGRSVAVETEIVEDRTDEYISWRSTGNSDIDTEGRIAFRDAPPGRGTCVEAVIAYKPPAGELGRLIAKFFQREPSIQVRRDLKRFKMLMETGEVATSSNRRDHA
ncbi:MAG: SRPBCC family protein [Acetobacterales bacterium]